MFIIVRGAKCSLYRALVVNCQPKHNHKQQSIILTVKDNNAPKSIFGTLGDMFEATLATSVRKTPPSDATKEWMSNMSDYGDLVMLQELLSILYFNSDKKNQIVSGS